VLVPPPGTCGGDEGGDTVIGGVDVGLCEPPPVPVVEGLVGDVPPPDGPVVPPPVPLVEGPPPPPVAFTSGEKGSLPFSAGPDGGVVVRGVLCGDLWGDGCVVGGPWLTVEVGPDVELTCSLPPFLNRRK
jgi:hypothetical protein